MYLTIILSEVSQVKHRTQRTMNYIYLKKKIVEIIRECMKLSHFRHCELLRYLDLAIQPNRIMTMSKAYLGTRQVKFRGLSNNTNYEQA